MDRADKQTYNQLYYIGFSIKNSSKCSLKLHNSIYTIYNSFFQVVLCKDGDGKVGLRVKAINKGIFVALVAKQTPASMGGLKFGDQILQINNETVAGYTAEKVHSIFKKAGVNNIVLAVRDR